MKSLQRSITFEHGGDIISASEYYAIALDQWLDLSTGLSPYSYPTKGIPKTAFQHLPYLQPQFKKSAASYYASDAGIPLIGSQMLIQVLPQCVGQFPVLLPSVGYSEHQKSWENAEVDTNYYPALQHVEMLSFIDDALQFNNKQHLVIINPNNPSGLLIAPEQIIKWASELADGCCLIVDEAFIDVTPSLSVLTLEWPENMVVLRSFGKFFGLAGVRIGFAFCQGVLRERIERKLGLWMINGPAQYLATQAMLDKNWQQKAILKIEKSAQFTQRLFAPLIDHVLKNQKNKVCWFCHQALFNSYAMPLSYARRVQDHFAQSAILLRVIVLPDAVQRSLSANGKGLVGESVSLLRVGILAIEDTKGEARIVKCIRDFIRDNSPHIEE